MPGFVVKVDISELSAAMTGLSKRVRDQIASAAVKKSAIFLRDQARRAAPRLRDISTLGGKSQGRIPGSLRRGIIAKRYGGGGRVAWGVFTRDRASFGISQSDKWYYPALVEYGHTVKSSLSAGNRIKLTRLANLTRRYGSNASTTGRIRYRAKQLLKASVIAKKSVAPRYYMRNQYLKYRKMLGERMASDIARGIETYRFQKGLDNYG